MRSETELLDIAQQYSFRGRIDKGKFTGPIFVHGQDSVVTDVNGKTYLDFNSGQMCAALGHNPPKVVAAIQESCKSLIHAHSSYFNVKEIELAERLAEIVPHPLRKSLFLLSGADANEAAINIAKRYTGGFEVASPHISFHGMSDSTRAVTFAGWHQGYGPPVPGSYAMVAPYCYRCPLKQTFPDCEYACLETSFELLDAQSVGAMAAVITEPLFSAGGVVEPPPGWLKELKRMCDDRGMLLILDEAQTGLAKLGTMFAFEQEEVVPDVVTISKHFGGGISISAAVTTAEIEAQVASQGFVFTHSHTNDPLACAAAIASIDIIQSENLPQRAIDIGTYLKAQLTELAQEFELIGDVRGRGLIQGIEFVKDRTTKEPATEAGAAITQHCLENGLIFSQRRGGSVFRFVPPFTTTSEQIDQAIDTLAVGIKQAVGG